MLFVGTDVGGTFTDVVIFDEESRKSPEVIKAPTDLKRPELAIVKALGKYQGRTEQFALVSHATTIATNSLDRKSTRLNSSHSQISYAVFCLKKKKNTNLTTSH